MDVQYCIEMLKGIEEAGKVLRDERLRVRSGDINQYPDVPHEPCARKRSNATLLVISLTILNPKPYSPVNSGNYQSYALSS